MKAVRIVILCLALYEIIAQCPHQEAGLSNWSNGATWGGSVPTAGSIATITSGMKVLMDVSPPTLRGIRIETGGTLIFSPITITLTTEYILTYGRLAAGSTTCPYTGNLEIILKTPSNINEDLDGFGTKVIGIGTAGSIEFVGATKNPSWTVLTSTAKVGDKSLQVLDSGSWIDGDSIVIASTDYDPAQAEVVTISAVSGKTINFTPALKFSHYGGDGTNLIDERGEVGLLSRNIIVRGDLDTNSFGGHIMGMMGVTKFHLERIRVSNCGQKGVMGRYPIHMHMMQNMTNSASVLDNSVVNNFQRCIVVHATNHTLVKNNVAYNTSGHCYFLEDGVEQFNELNGNLGILTKKGSLLPSDSRPATFWITHPTNTIINNVAAGSEQFGFWYALPKFAIGLSHGKYPGITPFRAAMGTFRDNKGHSNGQDALFIDEGPDVNNIPSVNGYDPRVDQNNDKSASVQAVFESFTAYKNRNRGVWSRGGELKFTGFKCANNAICSTHAAGNQGQAINENQLVIAETANLGNPRPWEIKGIDGRSLPIPWNDSKTVPTDAFSYPIRGIEFYDGPVTYLNPDIRGFAPNTLRDASCISYLRKNRFALNPQNRAIGVKCDQASKKVYFFDTLGDGDNSASFFDQTGEVAGTPNQIVVRKRPFINDDSCVCKDEWLACICTPNHGQLQFQIVDTSSVAFYDGTMIEMAREDLSRRVINTQYIHGQPFEQKIRDSFPTTVVFGKSYLAQFNFSAPNRLRMYLNFADLGKSIRIGLCYPKEATNFVVTANWNSNKPLTMAASLDKLVPGTYYRDMNSGFVYFNMTQDKPRATWQTPGYYPVVEISATNPIKTITQCLPANSALSKSLGFMVCLISILFMF